MPRMKHFGILCAVMLFTAFALPARAELIVINASNYSLGTDLSVMFPGLTMSRLSQSGGSTIFDPVVSPVYATIDYPVPIQSLGGTYGLFDYQNCSNAIGSSFSCVNGYNVLEFRFDEPTSFFQIDGYFFSDENYINAYDALGNLIAGFGAGDRTYAPGINGTTRSTLTLARDQRDIARVLYGDFHGNTVTPTEVSYNVPEPTTLGLVTLGLLYASFRRCRSRKRTGV